MRRAADGDALVALRAARAATTDRIAATTAEMNQLMAAATDSNLDDEHDPEGATIAFERSQLAASLAQAMSQQNEIEQAIGRVESGDYGRCEGCGGQIGDERLAAIPMTRLCISCAARNPRSRNRSKSGPAPRANPRPT